MDGVRPPHRDGREDDRLALRTARAHLLPLATDPDRFSPGGGDDELRGRVVFVGSPRFASASGFFAALDESRPAHEIAALLAAEIQRTRRPPSVDRVETLVAELDPERTLDPEARRRLPAFAVQQANLAYRVEMLNAIAQLRPFDAGACARVVLNDRLEALPDVFGDRLAGAIVFDDGGSLHELAGSLASNPARRRELGDALRETVLARHTIGHRVERMLATVRADETRG